jgi:hypothetical protein
MWQFLNFKLLFGRYIFIFFLKFKRPPDPHCVFEIITVLRQWRCRDASLLTQCLYSHNRVLSDKPFFADIMAVVLLGRHIRTFPFWLLVVVIAASLNDSSSCWTRRDEDSTTWNVVAVSAATTSVTAFTTRRGASPKCRQLQHRCRSTTNNYRTTMMTAVGGGGDHQAQRQPQQQQQIEEERRKIVDRSTLVLLEHVNLNVPAQDLILPFYFDVLGCTMDPRKVENIHSNPDSSKKTLWANAGASQFHLPYGEVAQCIPGQIGLRYDSLTGLEQRMQQYPSAYKSSSILENGNCIRLVDHYNNVFYCRSSSTSRVSPDWKQPILSRHADDSSTDHDDIPAWKKEVMGVYGRDDYDSDDGCCRGIDYIEFKCPMGAAEKIALFYNGVFDATTFCVEATNNDDDSDKTMVAIIAIGKIDENGRADQTLLFRETNKAIPPYDGHHIAIYIGTSDADFAQAFGNAQWANIVWTNPRFADQAVTVNDAVQKWKQFRFKNIVDLNTGATIMELEHEIRSTQHGAWPGPRPMLVDY